VGQLTVLYPLRGLSAIGEKNESGGPSPSFHGAELSISSSFKKEHVWEGGLGTTRDRAGGGYHKGDWDWRPVLKEERA